MKKRLITLRALRHLAVFAALFCVSLEGNWLLDRDYPWAVPVGALSAGIAFFLVWKAFDAIEHRFVSQEVA